MTKYHLKEMSISGSWMRPERISNTDWKRAPKRTTSIIEARKPSGDRVAYCWKTIK
ncbi:hypothetical protein ACFL6Y_00575 [Elusimicrobiota bacterium]